MSICPMRPTTYVPMYGLRARLALFAVIAASFQNAKKAEEHNNTLPNLSWQCFVCVCLHIKLATYIQIACFYLFKITRRNMVMLYQTDVTMS